MSSWASLLLEGGMAVLMAALIGYCVKLNRHLSLLRNQDSEIRDLIAGLRDASERADVSVQRLKAAGLAAERSLRSAIEEASAKRLELVGLASGATSRPADRAQEETAAPTRGATSAAPSRPAPEKRDMLMTATAQSAAHPPVPATRPRTREEAEESVIQAIRSARGEA